MGFVSAPRVAARILTGSTYAVLGFDAELAPGARVDQAAPTLAVLLFAVCDAATGSGSSARA